LIEKYPVSPPGGGTVIGMVTGIWAATGVPATSRQNRIRTGMVIVFIQLSIVLQMKTFD
jgi:F0F1-type ATP synthase membrane subunit c/vacuolar-type H+-ATPase subunit K